jgi:hypothetical protein
MPPSYDHNYGRKEFPRRDYILHDNHSHANSLLCRNAPLLRCSLSSLIHTLVPRDAVALGILAIGGVFWFLPLVPLVLVGLGCFIVRCSIVWSYPFGSPTGSWRRWWG